MKSKKTEPYPPPEWVGDILLAKWAGLNIYELLELDVIWVERLRELRYQALTQEVGLLI